MKTIKYFSMFSGIAGFELGIGKKGKCIGYSEIDKYAIQIYKKHFPNHKNYGDATTIKPNEVPDHDLLVGGFPCQSFSIAGKRGGFKDTRGTLFFDIAKILKTKRPKNFILENVKGLLSHDKGNTFATIISTIDELGYDCQWSVLNSKNFGVPQNRERVFIIGHLRGTSRLKVFPIGKDDQMFNGQAGKDNKQTSDSKNQITRTINSRLYKMGDADNYVKVPSATQKGYETAEEGDSINLAVLNSKTRRGRVGKKVAQTIDTGMQQHTLQDAKIRRLTPTECERLQGFPNGWTEGVSDTQRYKTLGNAVTVNVIEAIINKLI